MVSSLQKDVRRLRRQIRQRDRAGSGDANLQDASSGQPNKTPYDPYNAPMERFLARTASVASRMSTSTRITDLDSIYGEDVPMDFQDSFYDDSNVPQATQGAAAEYYAGDGKDLPPPYATEVTSLELLRTQDRGISEPISKPSKNLSQFRNLSWKSLMSLKGKDKSASSLNPVPETESQVSEAQTPPTLEPVVESPPPLPPRAISQQSTGDSGDHFSQHPSSSQPETPNMSNQSLDGYELTKSTSTPIMPFRGVQCNKPRAIPPDRSMSTPVTTSLYDCDNKPPLPTNPYTLSKYSSSGSLPINNMPQNPIVNDRDTLLASRQASFSTAPMEDGPKVVEDRPKTDPEALCRACKIPIQTTQHYVIKSSPWHTPCFRCSSCNILLSSSPIPFLLANDFLVCNSCAYNCQKCDQRIEEHGLKDEVSRGLGAMMTAKGCEGLFFCHECGKSIKNGRFTRTGKGVFCLGCQNPIMSEMERHRREGERERNRNVPVLVGEGLML